MSNSHGKLGVRGAWVILLFVIAVPWTSARLVARFWADARGDTQRALDAYNAACNETQCPDPDAAYAAICVTAADEHRNIVEFVLHHLSMGVGKVYVIDSGRSMKRELERSGLLDTGVVTHRWLTDPESLNDELRRTAGYPYDAKFTQLMAYQLCLRDHAANHTWMAFIDADEFVLLRDASLKGSFPRLLRQYERYGGLALSWRMYGSSGHLERPSTPLVQAFTACTERSYGPNIHVKAVVRTAAVAGIDGPHTFRYKKGFEAVNEDGQPVVGPFAARPAWRRIVLRHYALRSREDFAVKMARGDGMGGGKRWNFFDELDASSTADCSRPDAWDGA